MPRGCFVATEVLLHAVKCALSKLQGEPRLDVLIVSTSISIISILFLSDFYLFLLINVLILDFQVRYDYLSKIIILCLSVLQQTMRVTRWIVLTLLTKAL